MVTLLGSILGFLSSAFPELLKILKDRHDRKHELEIFDRQVEMAKLGHSQRLEEIQINADSAEAVALYNHASLKATPWVDALSGSVRPLITYAFFILYAGVKCAQWAILRTAPTVASWGETLLQLWQLEDQVLFATVMAFWFGQRTLRHRLGR